MLCLVILLPYNPNFQQKSTIHNSHKQLALGKLRKRTTRIGKSSLGMSSRRKIEKSKPELTGPKQSGIIWKISRNGGLHLKMTLLLRWDWSSFNGVFTDKEKLARLTFIISSKVDNYCPNGTKGPMEKELSLSCFLIDHVVSKYV